MRLGAVGPPDDSYQAPMAPVQDNIDASGPIEEMTVRKSKLPNWFIIAGLLAALIKGLE